ncbi:hypothetical protein UBN113_03150 [Helicobacter pylori]
MLSLSMKKQGIKLWRRLLIMANVRTYTFFTFNVGHRIYKHKFKIEPYYETMPQNKCYHLACCLRLIVRFYANVWK